MILWYEHLATDAYFLYPSPWKNKTSGSNVIGAVKETLHAFNVSTILMPGEMAEYAPGMEHLPTFTYICHAFNLSPPKKYVYIYIYVHIFIHIIFIYRQIFQFLWDIWMGCSMGRSLLRFWHSWLFSVSWPLVGSCWIHGWKRGNLRAS